MNPIYRFYIEINGDRRRADPLYGNDVFKEYAIENDQQYYRTNLKGKFKFVKSDYAFILAASFDATINVEIEKSNDRGRSFSSYFTGKFMRTDCTINTDDQVLETSFTPIDGYEDIVAGLEKEFDLITLAPAIQPCIVYKRPAIQIYVAGDSVITTFVGGTYFEQDALQVTDKEELEQKYYFYNLAYAASIKITGASIPEINGTYALKSQSGILTNTGLIPNSSNTYAVQFVTEDYSAAVGGYYSRIFRVIRLSDSAVIYERNTMDYATDSVDKRYLPGVDYSVSAIANTTDKCTMSYLASGIFARYLVDVDKVSNVDTNDLPLEDITENSGNYRKVIGYNFDVITINSTFSTEPTEYGIYQPGLYYQKPYSIYGTQFYPVAKSQWTGASIWFSFYVMDQAMDEKARKPYSLRHSYTLASCIKVLLGKIAPDLTFEPDALHSQFLFSSRNPVSSNIFELLIAPKTNLLKGEYDQPAQKAKITLKQIFDMLRACFRCYWYVEGKRLKIEHVSYFRNGLSYIGPVDPGLDLTVILDPKTKKPWSFGANKYTFEKAKMPEYYQFGWMDDVTTPFEGYPIEVLSAYVEKGNIETVTVNQFSSDVDLMLLNPSAFNEDGFALLAVVPADLYSDPLNYFSKSTTAEDGGLSTPTHNVKTDIIGSLPRTAVLTGSVDSACTLRVVFYKDGEVIARSANKSISKGSFTFENLSIPVGTTALGLESVSGAFTAQLGSFVATDVKELPFITSQIDNYTYILQNGLLSFIDLQPKYYTKDLPATHVKINNQEVWLSSKMTKRNRLQTLKFPSGKNDINPMQLITTNLGNGQVDNVKINLMSRIAEATLLYDNE